MEIIFNNLLNIYEQEISKNVKNKKQVLNFEINKMQNIANIKNMLENGNVGHTHYNIFLVYEPKCRLIMSLPIKDKIINHYLTRYILEPRLTKYLDIRNCATRKKMGTDYGVNLIRKYLRILKSKYKEFYVLKIDIQKYFYNIDHNVLKSLLKNRLEKDEYNLIKGVINSTNYPYINEIIDKYYKEFGSQIPNYEYNKGLPIGNMTSQFLSIFYLHELDHYIVHDLKCKYYVRYMDDFIIMHNDKNYLSKVRDIIINELRSKYLLNVNEKKTNIINVKNGFSFLGYVYKVINNKIIINIRSSSYAKIKKKIKRTKYEMEIGYKNYNQVFCSIMTYLYSYKYANNERIKNIINRYFFDEK